MRKLWDKLSALLANIKALQVPVFASHASFFIILSAFPALVLLLSLLRNAGLQVSHLTELLEGVVPDALMPAAKKLILNTYRGTTGTMVSVSVLAVLWSAGRGFYGLCNGLDVVYGIRETRGFVRSRLLSMVYTFAFLLVLLLTLVLHLFGRSLLMWFPGIQGLPERLVEMRFLLLLGAQTLLFTTMYALLPARRNRLGDSLPGAVLAALGWLIFSDLYSVYVERFAGLSDIYGSVYAVALSMLWLYCCVSIVFYGGALNCWLTDKSESC